jgi:hypothetical protein
MTKARIMRTIYIVVACGIATVFTSQPVLGQSDSETVVRIQSSAPSDEKFLPVSDLVATWRGCGKMPDNRPEHGCDKLEYSREFQRSWTFTLYEPDGAVWWRASTQSNDQYREKGTNYFWTNKKKEFEPFAVDSKIHGFGLVLRMAAESPNWYEVEVNERTRETKFVHKKDPAWSKTSWDFWMKYGVTMQLPENHEPLRDAPNGNTLEEGKSKKYTRVTFIKMDGDWAYVEGNEPLSSDADRLRGWIRWRKGRELLVGCFLNQRQAPDQKLDLPTN